MISLLLSFTVLDFYTCVAKDSYNLLFVRMQYYKYVLETPYALTGSHNLAKATAKGNTVVLFVASASEKQWPSSEKILQAMVDSFEV